jgi:rubrerythrin
VKDGKYVRCRYCDTGIGVTQIVTKPRKKDTGVNHDKVFWVCPVCGHSNESYIFISD